MERVQESDQETNLRPSAETAEKRTPETLGRIAQAKLTVGHADDPFELEAEQTADLVVRSLRGDGIPTNASSGRIQRRSTATSTATAAAPQSGDRIQGSRRSLQRVIAPTLQRRGPIGREGGSLDTETEQSLQSARSGGRPLDPSLQRQMGDVMGADLSSVRLHSGEQSRDLNDQISAEAFTVGSDVFFRDGVPDTQTNGGLGLVAHEVAHTVQQGASPVQRRVSDRDEEAKEGAESESEIESETEEKSDETESGETEPESETESGESETEEKSDGETAEPVLSGTISEVKEMPDPEDVTGAGKWEEDAQRVRGAKAQRTARASTARRGSPIAVEVGEHIGTTSSVSQFTPSSGDADKLVGGKIGATGQIVGPTPKSSFGAMGTTIKISGVKWTLAKGTIKVDLSIDGKFEWGTSGGTKKDVSAPNSDLVTADNYEEMAADLTPALAGKCWRPPRKKYWSQAITERHEKYHAKDADKWVKKKGPGVVKSYLKKNPIELTDDERKDATVVEKKVNDVLREALKEVIQGRVYYFRKGLDDYLSYPGEIRAFGDGKAPYQKLAKGVRAHGKKLAAAAKKAAKESAGAKTPEEAKA